MIKLDKFDAIIDELKESFYSVLDRHDIKLNSIEQDTAIDEALCRLMRDLFTVEF